jgi:hypothetical protein
VDETATSLQLLVGQIDGPPTFRLIGEPWDPGLEVWWEPSPDRSSVAFVSTPGNSRLISIDDGTSRPLDVEVGDYVSWQRLPIEP